MKILHFRFYYLGSESTSGSADGKKPGEPVQTNLQGKQVQFRESRIVYFEEYSKIIRYMIRYVSHF